MNKALTAIAILIACALPDASAWSSDWTDRELRILRSLSLDALGPVPESVSNEYADDPEVAEFGKLLFFDRNLSPSGEFSCASCHEPAKRYTDGLARSQGAGEVMRNSSTLVGVAYNRWFYWDGRRDSLWAQALIPFEAADEMGGNRVAVVRYLAGHETYASRYLDLLGPELDALPLERLPEDAGPFGTPDARAAWTGMSQADQHAVNVAYVKVGKALAAFQRTLLPEETRFDRFVRTLDDPDARPDPDSQLTPREIAGAKLFMDTERTQCLQCHNGALLTNGEFHNIGSGRFSGEELDFGRSIGLRAVLMDEFNCLGPYSDAEQHQCRELIYLNKDSHLPLRGAFKVPTLRGLSDTAPYFHDGRFRTIRQVLDFYNDPPPAEEVGPNELRPMGLSDEELASIRAFLLTLSD